MKHVLHLASWYPNRKGPQEGDFIQRQLQALAAYTPVHVIAVIKDDKLKPGSTSIGKNDDGNLYETVAYYNGYKTGIKKLDTLLSLLAYQKTFQKLIAQHIITHGKPELIHVHIAFRAGLIALWSARKYKTPYIVSEHWSGYKKEDKSGFYFQPPAIKLFIKKILNRARAIVPVSASLAEDIKKITTNTNFAVVHNVVDESLFSPPTPADKQSNPAPANKQSKKFRFLHVSTMGPEKQPEMLFRAFDTVSKNGEAELFCLGTVPDGLAEWVSKNIRQSTDIVFLGNLPYGEVAGQMRKADCLVITSLYETFSCVAAEALLSGLPVIATPVGVIPDLVTPENGLIVKNEDELISAMRQMQANRTAFRPDLIAAAQKGKFSYQNVGAKLVELYNNL
ncbi:glycosyltransferase [Flavitalea sp.]|nr:glycosyltransferase [Flavitalea sp.]